MELHARAFYTAQALGVADKLHQPLFTITLVVERRPLNNEKQIENLFADYGVDREAWSCRLFILTASIAKSNKPTHAHAIKYGIGGTPEMIVIGQKR